MKKLILSFIGVIFIFTSCDLLLGILDGLGSGVTEQGNMDESGSTSINDPLLENNSNNIFYVQVNNTDTNLNNRQVGYIKKSNSNSRSAENDSEEIEELLELDTKVKIKNIPNQIIENENSKTFERLIPDTSRSTYSTKLIDEKRVIGKTYDFFIYDQKQNPASYKATCMASGEFCNVYFIDNTKLVSSSDIDFNQVAVKFDSIYEKETSIFGSNIYKSKLYTNVINPVTKINVVIADIMEKAVEDQNSGTFGYFSQNDCLYNTDGSDGSQELSTSNETQAIFVDSYFLKIESDQVYSTLVHEFNHLLNFVNKTVAHGSRIDTWYTEMLSTIAEDLFQHSLSISDEDSAKGRLSAFCCSYNYGFTDWQNDDNNKVLYNYANCFAFGSFLIRNFGGMEMLYELAQNEYTNEECINKAFEKLNYDFDFDKALRYFPMVMINTVKNDKSDYFTLNKAVSADKFSDLYFDALDISNCIWYLGTGNGKNDYKEMHGPYLLDPNYAMPIYKSGFSITKICDKKEINSSYSYYYVDPETYPNFYTYFVNYNKKIN